MVKCRWLQHRPNKFAHFCTFLPPSSCHSEKTWKSSFRTYVASFEVQGMHTNSYDPFKRSQVLKSSLTIDLIKILLMACFRSLEIISPLIFSLFLLSSGIDIGAATVQNIRTEYGRPRRTKTSVIVCVIDVVA